jgi:hypothetical protein
MRVPHHANVESGVMAHQGVGLGVADDPVGRLLPARRTCHHFGVDAVQPGVEAVELVEPGW